jgi:hypothetical protein
MILSSWRVICRQVILTTDKSPGFASTLASNVTVYTSASFRHDGRCFDIDGAELGGEQTPDLWLGGD